MHQKPENDRLQKEQDDCALEISQVKARVENLKADSNTEQGQKYLKDTQTELKHVSWPTRRQAVVFTVVVVVLSILIAAYLGALDVVFTWVVENFII